MTLDALLQRLDGVRSVSDGFVAQCPAHPDHVQSLSLSEAEDRLLVHCHAGCETKAVLDALDLDWKALFLSENGTHEPLSWDPEEEYVYTDETGVELYRVIRYPGKRFKHVRRKVPYRLPALMDLRAMMETVYIVEGEKDVHALEAAGKLATTGGGVGVWEPAWASYFQDLRIIIVQDKDEPGVKHARDVAAMLYPAARSIWIVQAREGKDVADHLEAGLPVENLEPIERVK